MQASVPGPLSKYLKNSQEGLTVEPAQTIFFPANRCTYYIYIIHTHMNEILAGD